MTRPADVLLRGVVAAGLGKAARFTDLPWVWQQFAAKLDLHVWPGTFNVRVVEPDVRVRWEELRQVAGVEITPPDAATCVAVCYRVLVNDWVRGAIVLPHVPGYPEDQIEVVAAEHVRSGLRLEEGDVVVLRVVPSWDGSLPLINPYGVSV